MEQLKMKDILGHIKYLQSEGVELKDILEMPVYIGRDEELNGIHTGCYCQVVDPNKEEDRGFVDLINEDCCNRPIKDKAILIS